MPSSNASNPNARKPLPTYLDGEFTLHPTASPHGTTSGPRQPHGVRSQDSGSVIIRDLSNQGPTSYKMGSVPRSDRRQLVPDADQMSVDRHRDRYGEGSDAMLGPDDRYPGSVASGDRYDDEASLRRAARYERDHYDGSPASRTSNRSRTTVERIVSLPFPSARASSIEEYVKPDERDDIIRELRASISRLEKKVNILQGEKATLIEANAHAHEENTILQKEVVRLNKILEEERAMMQLNLASEETKRREAYELVDLQRKLLLVKDEEIRQLSQLAAAHKEQIFVLYSHLGSVEINNILEDNFDIHRVDVNTLDPDSRTRVLELIKAPSLEARFDTTGPRKIEQPGQNIFVLDRSTAYAMDAADGVMDGKFQGHDIMVPKGAGGAPGRPAVRSSGYGKSPSVASSDRMSDLKRQLSAARKEKERAGGVYRK